MNPMADDFEDFSSKMTEEQCILLLYKSRWPAGFRCRRCGHGEAYTIRTRRLPLFECKQCASQVSLISGTVFEGSRTPLHLWFQAIYLHCPPQGINAVQLSEIIGVTYKTSWLICHKIRHAMSEAERTDLLDGSVRIAPFVLFRRFCPSPEWQKQEQSILMGCSENESGEITKIKIKHQNKQVLRSRYTVPNSDYFVRQNVTPEVSSSIIFENRPGKLKKLEMLRIKWDVQRRLAKLFRGIGPKYLQKYLDQFSYEWNRGKAPSFRGLLVQCALTSTITLPQLIGQKTRHFIHASRTRSRTSLQVG